MTAPDAPPKGVNEHCSPETDLTGVGWVLFQGLRNGVALDRERGYCCVFLKDCLGGMDAKDLGLGGVVKRRSKCK